ncbi:MAG TPA: FxsA family protein [Solirubrobacteraceae bacterium]|jgi:UPF0716 protein FxsA|nr:FxsA family protein [Solirubrobacteraceae bacterium]
MVLVPLLLFLLWPVAELIVVIKVAETIGVLWTIVLLIASWPLGSWALRSQGRAVWRRMSAAISAGRAPGKEVLDGVLVLLGGFLLMIPGFISDAFGLLFLLPLTRIPLRRLLARHSRSRIVTQTVRFTSRGQTYDVDSTGTDMDTSPPRLRP